MYDTLTTVPAVKAWANVTGANDDPEIAILIPVASELIGRFCGRENLGAVLPYTENYFGPTRNMSGPGVNFDVILRHWPVVTLTSVTLANTSLPILQPTQLQQNLSGAYLQEDYEARIVKCFYTIRTYPITVVYTAGYAAGSVPRPLQQACAQFVMEILRSNKWVGLKSSVLAGETTSYDLGGSFGMSNRVQKMLAPFLNLVPFMGY